MWRADYVNLRTRWVLYGATMLAMFAALAPTWWLYTQRSPEEFGALGEWSGVLSSVACLAVIQLARLGWGWKVTVSLEPDALLIEHRLRRVRYALEAARLEVLEVSPDGSRILACALCAGDRRLRFGVWEFWPETHVPRELLLLDRYFEQLYAALVADGRVRTDRGSTQPRS